MLILKIILFNKYICLEWHDMYCPCIYSFAKRGVFKGLGFGKLTIEVGKI